ncbi:MAG: hypothetical protein R3E65_10920 [Steroidobacteraceae bacterium]
MSGDRQPLRDVYTGDLTNVSNPPSLVRAVFEVRADADPGALHRVAAMLALANVAPLRMTCERESTCEILIAAVLDGISVASADLMLRKLQQLSVVVEATLMCEEMPQLIATPPTADPETGYPSPRRP